MFKNLKVIPTIILLISILVSIYKLIDNIKVKKEIQKSNEEYITNNEETGFIEYKSDTLYINIT